MKFSTLIKHSAELFRIIQKSPTPADELTSQYLRAKKYIGSSERKVISEIVFCSLRITSLARKAVDEFMYDNKLAFADEKLDLATVTAVMIIIRIFPDSPLTSLQSRLDKFTATSADFSETILLAIQELEVFAGIEQKFITHCTKFSNIFLSDINSDKLLSHNYLCLQDWIVKSLANKYSAYDVNQLAFKLMYPASVCLRVNILNINRDNVLNILSENSISATPSKISPDGILLSGRPQLSNFDFYKNGSVEVQDIGSQVISYSVGIQQNSTILDACAGAGGKTLHIAAICADNAKIVATDTEFNRLKEIKIRANKAGIASIEVIPQKKMELKDKIKTKFNYILIDAPCSGTGTVRRMPMPKWRLTEKLLSKLNKAQSSILAYYADMLEVGGSLVYATCSLLPEENEMIINKFLAEHTKYLPEPIKPALTEAGVQIDGINEDDYMLYLTPLNGETDGFFLSKITRKEN